MYLSSACSSFANGLELVEGYFAMNKASKALIICSEHNTYYSNESDPKCGHLWGDAAVALFVSKEKQNEDESQILDVYIYSWTWSYRKRSRWCALASQRRRDYYAGREGCIYTCM